MNTEHIIRIMAGSLVLLSLALGAEASPIFHNVNWLWLNAFIGINLFQSGFTKFCPPEILLKKLGIKSVGGSCKS
ncbi:MAG: DUF2892 domain-containing protein [Gammaproteobacteria bacterium]|nr:DUF2892 domain-containing protein [Gammaproteobacteria bacterium]